MERDPIAVITEHLRQLPADKLVLVREFVLVLREHAAAEAASESAHLSEPVLSRDWDRAEEDAAWAHL